MFRFARQAGFVLLLAASSVVAQPPERPMLDLLPESEFGAVLIRSPAGLIRQWKELEGAVGTRSQFNPGEVTGMAVKWLGVPNSYDDDRPIGVLLTNQNELKVDFEGLVVAVPFRDRDQIAADVRLKAEPRVVGRIEPGPQLGSDFWMYGATDESHLYLGGGRQSERSRTAVQSVLTDPRLSAVCSPSARQQLNNADILLHMGAAELMKNDPERYVDRLWDVDAPHLDEEERPVVREFQQAARELEHLFSTVRLADGLAFHQRYQFRADRDSTSGRLLRELRGVTDETAATPANGPTLHGLPAGPVMAAGTARLPRARQQLLFRTLVSLLASAATPNWESEWSGGALTDLRQAVLLGALVDVLPLTTELRFAIYPNADHTVATIVVMESDDPERVVATIRELSDLLVQGSDGRGTGADETAVTEADLRKMVRELSAEDFAIRSRATTRLLLLGERARPVLTAASTSGDAEVAARASNLLAKLDAAAQGKDQQVLKDNPLAGAHPRLTYHVEAEQALGRPVDVIRLQLPEDEAPRVKQLTDLFGRDWDRVRIARLPGHVVLAFGTPGTRWTETLSNLAENRPGLALDPRLATLPEDPDRLIELHVPFSRLVPANPRPYWSAGRPKDMSPSRALTATGLSASANEVSLDMHLPVDELRGLVARQGWPW